MPEQSEIILSMANFTSLSINKLGNLEPKIASNHQVFTDFCMINPSTNVLSMKIKKLEAPFEIFVQKR